MSSAKLHQTFTSSSCGTTKTTNLYSPLPLAAPATISPKPFLEFRSGSNSSVSSISSSKSSSGNCSEVNALDQLIAARNESTEDSASSAYKFVNIVETFEPLTISEKYFKTSDTLMQKNVKKHDPKYDGMLQDMEMF